MRITGTGHAGMRIDTSAGSILCDPWVNPAYFASWFPFPDNSALDWEALGQTDYLYVSHLHRDHFDAAHLARYVSKKATVLLAVAIGVIVACAATYLMDYVDDTLKNPDDVQAKLGLATLGAVPRMEDGGPVLVGLVNSRSPGTEAYRVLRTNLQFAAVGTPLHTLLVTSASPSEGPCSS